MDDEALAAWHGTPPRLWGKLLCAGGYRPNSRYIPTPVGKTSRCKLSSYQFLRYTPTPVGKTGSGGRDTAGRCGTPPRLWGKHIRLLPPTSPCRYTPTPVGKTSSSSLMLASSSGTPPRLWGKRALREAKLMHLRYTPTPVGKTSRIPHLCVGVTVYPRYTPTPVGKT